MAQLEENVIYFLAGVKTFHIGRCLKPQFYKKMSITWKLYDRFFSNFSKQASELSCLKSIVTVELAALNAGQV